MVTPFVSLYIYNNGHFKTQECFGLYRLWQMCVNKIHIDKCNFCFLSSFFPSFLSSLPHSLLPFLPWNFGIESRLFVLNYFPRLYLKNKKNWGWVSLKLPGCASALACWDYRPMPVPPSVFLGSQVQGCTHPRQVLYRWAPLPFALFWDRILLHCVDGTQTFDPCTSAPKLDVFFCWFTNRHSQYVLSPWRQYFS